PLTDASHCGATSGCGVGSGNAGAVCATGQKCDGGRCGCISLIVSMGDTCAIRNDKTAWCGLEPGNTTHQEGAGLGPLAQIAVAFSYHCVVDNRGFVSCWGGYIGNGTSDIGPTPASPDLTGRFSQVQVDN